MRKKRYRQPIEEPPVNITPLIDVIFVILIMFIVIAPLLDIDKIELARGGTEKEKETSLRENHPITIHVYQDNTIKYNQRQVLLPQLKALLSSARKHHPGYHPQIFHDKRAHFGTYQAVKNAVENAGFEEMDIVLSPG